ncbi:MAG: hypothetical protein AAF292_11085 [Pseudomonadota bacterium]
MGDWYRVIKTINGRQYLYEQKSWREGGKVRTQSRSLGPLAAAVIANIKRTTSSVDGTLDPEPDDGPALSSHQERALASAARKREDAKALRQQNLEAINPADLKPAFNTTNDDALRFKAKLKHLHISQTAWEQEHKKLAKHLDLHGLSLDRLPTVTVKAGKSVGMKANGDGFIITVPRKKPAKTSVRNQARRAYREALAGVWLGALADQHPSLYDNIQTSMDKQHRNRKWATVRYILSMNTSNPKWALTLHYVMTGQLSQWVRRNVASDKLGLSDHDVQSDWQASTRKLMADCMHHGMRKTKKKYIEQLKVAETTEAAAMRRYKKLSVLDGLNGRKARERKAINRAIARRHAIRSTLRQLDELEPIFKYYGSRPKF